jgi:hypothetical protein
MLEDTPVAIQHGRQNCVMGNVRGAAPGEVYVGGIH